MVKKELKNKLRQNIFKKKLCMNAADYKLYNESLVQKLSGWLLEKKFKKIFIYYPHRLEPNVLPLFSSFGSDVEFAMPVVGERKQMEFYSWKEGEVLVENIFGIKEPLPVEANLRVLDQETLVLVPSVAIDEKGNRLGMGGGFYDRYFERYPLGFRVAVIFSFQLMKNLPNEKKDAKVNYIATEKSIQDLARQSS